MKLYPYIGKTKLGSIVIFYEKLTGRVIDHVGNMPEGRVCDYWHEDGFANITREHLEGKCVKIESPEHSEFVQKLAFNAGFIWMLTDADCLLPIKKGYIHFLSSGGMVRNFTTTPSEQIIIPLPPKADSEPKGWPQISDKVCYGNGVNCEVTGIHNEVAMIITELGDYHIAYLSELKKPKSEVEILLEDLRAHFEKYTFQDQAINELHLKFNITKKPQ